MIYPWVIIKHCDLLLNNNQERGIPINQPVEWNDRGILNKYIYIYIYTPPKSNVELHAIPEVPVIISTIYNPSLST